MTRHEQYEDIIGALGRARVDRELSMRLYAAEDPAEIIDPSVVVERGVILGNVQAIGGAVKLDEGAVIGTDVVIGNGVHIGVQAVIDCGAVLAPGLHIGNGGYIGPRVTVEPLTRDLKPDNEGRVRVIYPDAAVAADVVLPSDVQLGREAVVPSSDTISQIGPYGEHERMVTVYGTLHRQAAYSVGCQYGISGETLRQRVTSNTQTTPTSAKDYADHMKEIVALGAQVQEAFNDNLALARELEAYRLMLAGMQPTDRYFAITAE
ncbi:MAG: hypothetical protein KIH63_002260 [Candidatus Saccharibacteria bacterium]|nr:hypothetical protein [Candidatus Saccharibacteria bacterium]